jgi:FKBP-type peptidyl-prolyl cis-trans isomerase
MIFPSDLGIGGNSTQLIPAYSSFIFDIELLNVIYSPRRFEDSLMMAYLTANEFSLDSTDTGIYFKETEAGDGDFPEKYDEVTVSYTGKFLNGDVFDGTGKSFSFTIGTGAVIPGFEEGVKMIRKNGSATVVIPYYYAYGEAGRLDNQYRSVIPPFTTLVFDLSLTNIAK